MPRCWSEQCPPQAGLHSPKHISAASLNKRLSSPAGGRYPGAPALTWAPARRQPLSSSHPQTWGDAAGQPMSGRIPARSRDTLPGAGVKLRTRDLAGAGQTCGRERGELGRPGLGCRRPHVLGSSPAVAARGLVRSSRESRWRPGLDSCGRGRWREGRPPRALQEPRGGASAPSPSLCVLGTRGQRIQFAAAATSNSLHLSIRVPTPCL